jgi:hypothetical protein
MLRSRVTYRLRGREQTSSEEHEHVAQRVNRRTWQPYVDRLLGLFDEVVPDLHRLLDASGIRRNTINDDGGIYVVTASERVWGPETPEVSMLLMDLKPRWSAWEESLRALFPHPTHAVTKQLDEALLVPQAWIERKTYTDYFKVPVTEAHGHKVLDECAQKVHALKTLLQADSGTVVAVPDTSALLDEPDVAAYASQLATTAYEVLLVPTVLGELDLMKRAGRTHDIQNAAKAVVRRLKNLRDKGDPLKGVAVTKTISARFPMEHPKAAWTALPDWLDLDLPDDRIVAAALTIQRSRPADVVVVVTSDLNMQNKAAALGLPYVEPVP